MEKPSVSPLLATGKFLLEGCWVPQAMGVPAPEPGEQLSPREGEHRSCAHLYQSQLQFLLSLEVPLLEEGLRGG